ncbi:MAG: LysR family transcriptional regulator [Xanthobacteraceae bacterium]|nr:LysR family transcriptional regulator [Xanthobacteraceae bacterium]
MVHVSRIDLNLFVVFDAIFSEGGVTAAAARLNLTQPAVSHALARLRLAFGDPLFVRQGRTLVPTPRARRAIGEVRAAIRGLSATLADAGGFRPADARQTFTVGMRDITETTLMPDLMARLARAAPQVALSVVRAGRRSLEAELAAGTVDAAIDVLLPLGGAVKRQKLMSEPLAVLARRDHPRIRRRLTLARYLAEDHVVVSARRRGEAAVDLELARAGHQRWVKLRCQHYFAAARAVARTDLVCTVTAEMARLLARAQPLQVLRFPLPTREFDAFLYWHDNLDADPANRWLRELLVAAARTG